MVAGEDKRRLISITRGNVRQGHIYLTGHEDLFPTDSYGARSKARGQGRPVILTVSGLRDKIETDLANRARNGRRRAIFRRRGWIRKFFAINTIEAGDLIAIERTGEYSYRVSPFATHDIREGALLPEAKPRIHRESTGQMGFLAQGTSNGSRNKLLPADRAAHDWYRFVLSFPPQLVREYIRRFQVTPRKRVLDPFCGTGTTLVECKKLRVASIGLEAHPMPALASRVKADWTVDPGSLLSCARKIEEAASRELTGRVVPERQLPRETHALLLKDSISPLPLHKTLVLLEHIHEHKAEPCHEHLLLALATALVRDIGNLHFGPEVGLGPIKDDADVLGSWLANVRAMAADLRSLGPRASTPAHVRCHDAREALTTLRPRSVDAVITSPPYPNEKDYTRTTRLETVILGFIRDRKGLRHLKSSLLRSNTRNVYKHDDDHRWVAAFPAIERIARKIEARRVALGKTSGFERQYARVTRLYFGGMARHFADIRPALRPGAMLAYVVGDQASYLRIMIRTGQLLAEIAESLGYEVAGLDLFRTRLATATKQQLREEVLVLRWPG